MTQYELAFHWGVGSNDYYNVINYDIVGGDPPDFQAFVDTTAADYQNSMANVIAPAMEFRGVVFRLDIDGSVGTEVAPTAGPIPGQAGDDQFAGQLAVLAQKRTGGVVRPTLGRIFVPGVSAEGLNQFGEWTSNVTDAVEAFWTDMLLVSFSGGETATMQLKASNPNAPNTNPYNGVSSIVALSIPSALQSRKKGRGA